MDVSICQQRIIAEGHFFGRTWLPNQVRSTTQESWVLWTACCALQAGAVGLWEGDMRMAVHNNSCVAECFRVKVLYIRFSCLR